VGAVQSPGPGLDYSQQVLPGQVVRLPDGQLAQVALAPLPATNQQPAAPAVQPQPSQQQIMLKIIPGSSVAQQPVVVRDAAGQHFIVPGQSGQQQAGPASQPAPVQPSSGAPQQQATTRNVQPAVSSTVGQQPQPALLASQAAVQASPPLLPGHSQAGPALISGQQHIVTQLPAQQSQAPHMGVQPSQAPHLVPSQSQAQHLSSQPSQPHPHLVSQASQAPHLASQASQAPHLASQPAPVPLLASQAGPGPVKKVSGQSGVAGGSAAVKPGPVLPPASQSMQVAAASTAPLPAQPLLPQSGPPASRPQPTPAPSAAVAAVTVITAAGPAPRTAPAPVQNGTVTGKPNIAVSVVNSGVSSGVTTTTAQLDTRLDGEGLVERLEDLVSTQLGEDGARDGDLEHESASGAGQGSIDNRIEQAMDLVKSHLMSAVRSEVEELRDKISKLEDTVTVLSRENEVLRANVNQEVLAGLVGPRLGSNSITTTTSGGGGASDPAPHPALPPPGQH